MHAILEFYNAFSTEALLLMALFAVVAGTVAGCIMDYVMGARGFGIAGNAILIILGVAVGSILSFHDFGPLRLDETTRLTTFTAATSTLILLLSGMIKSWVRPAY